MEDKPRYNNLKKGEVFNEASMRKIY